MQLLKQFSKLGSKPNTASEIERAGYLKCQRLAEAGAREVTSLMKEGWTELQTAKLYETYLRDHGIHAFFHHPYAWFGERTRFDGIRTYNEYKPSKRVIRPHEVFILDSAPILNGFTSDIGYTSSLGENTELTKAQTFLKTLHDVIPSLFSDASTGGAVWEQIDQMIREAGYENIHQKYPFSVLGHRVHHHLSERRGISIKHFGWQSFWSITSRGIFGQLLNQHHEGNLIGLWAIEPHIGTKTFGAKFEEILVIDKNRAHWLEVERVGQ